MVDDEPGRGPGTEPGPPPTEDLDTEPLPRIPSAATYEDDVEGETPPSPDEPLHIQAEELSGLYGDGTNTPMGPRRMLPLEDEPSVLVSRYLFPTEKFRGEWRKHWIHLSQPLGIAVGATILLGWLTGFVARQGAASMITIGILAWLAVLGWVGWRVADWYYDRFILTNKRIMAISGIVDRKVAMMPLLRVTDMKYEQNATGRTLRYGTFVVESAGQDQALRVVKHLPNPNELYLRIVEEMYEPEAVEARLSRRVEGDDA